MANLSRIIKRLDQLDDDIGEILENESLDKGEVRALKTMINEKTSIYLNIMETLIDAYDLEALSDSEGEEFLS